jgi:hypothetical protein
MAHRQGTKDSGRKQALQPASSLASLQKNPLSPVPQLQQTIGNRATGAFIQARLDSIPPDGSPEQSADGAANQLMSLRAVAPIQPTSSAGAVDSHSDSAGIEPVSGTGQPLSESSRAFFEPRFGSDFNQVRVHTGSNAAESARSVNARAYTFGRDIVFGAGQYAPGSESGDRLLAHELAHVVQQEGAAVSNRMIRGPAGRKVMRQQAVPAAPSPQDIAQIAIEYLRSMRGFIGTLRRTTLYALPLIQPVPFHVGYKQHYRLHQQLSQQRVGGFLRQARSTYEAQIGNLPANDPLRLGLREAYVEVLDQIRLAAQDALTVSSGLSETRVAGPERARYAENLAAWAEANPMTSTGLAGTTVFQAGDVAAAARSEAVLEAYLDQLLQWIPTQNLDAALRSRIFERIQIALRRAFVTVAAGPGGTIDIRAISNQSILAKYRGIISLLEMGIANRAQMDVINFALQWQLPPNPVGGDAEIVASGHNLAQVNTSRVPPDEEQAVRFGIGSAWQNPPPGIQLVNAYWQLTMPVRRAGVQANVRYELVYDQLGNVRAERLGEDRPREVPPAFAQMNNAQKRAQLVADFGLRAVDDRPAHAATNRAAAPWTDAELDQVKTQFDLLAPAHRASLNGVTIVRDHQGVNPDDAGYTHLLAEPARDNPGPPAHGPPHIHYYDRAFDANTRVSVGAPGATGPGGDFTLAHEVGHMVILAPVVTANQQITAASQALNQAVGVTQMQQAPLAAWNQYIADQTAASNAITAYNTAIDQGQAAAQTDPMLQAAQAAVQTRNQSRAALQAANVPQLLIARGTALDDASDALLAASDRNPIFNSIATRFGFHRFTHYAATGGEKEWFTETFALFINDPNRLLQMNRSVFLWFQAGMPMDRNWNP